MLEEVGGLRQGAPAEYQACAGQLHEGRPQIVIVLLHDRRQQLVRELPTDCGCDLRYLPDLWTEAVKPRDQRSLEGSGHRKRGKRRRGDRFSSFSIMRTGFQHGLRQLFHKERDAISALDNLGRYVAGKRMVACHQRCHSRDFAPTEAAEIDRGYVRLPTPRWLEIG